MDGEGTTRVSGDGADPRPGDAGQVVAGRYRLGPLLGRGGVADVHRASDDLLGREVAVKLVRSEQPDPAALERFAAEMRTHAGLSHPNLVTVLDAGTAGARPFLVMELVEGRTMAVTAGDPWTTPVVARVGAEIASGLAHVHERGVVHRDLKPANVLIGDNGRVALSDFGIARLMEVDHGHTATGFTIGTAAYFAPEQVTGSTVTPAADVYSLALVLLEALTGERVYPGPPTQAAPARLQRPPRLPDGLPQELSDLLRRMTATEPEDRPGAVEVAEVLRQLGGAPDSSSGTATPRPAVPTDATRVMPVLAADPPRPPARPPTEARVMTGTRRPSAAHGVRVGTHPPAPVRAPARAARPVPGDLGRPRRRRPSPVVMAMLVVLLVIAAILTWTVLDATRTAAVDPAVGDQPLEVLMEDLDRAVNG